MYITQVDIAASMISLEGTYNTMRGHIHLKNGQKQHFSREKPKHGQNKRGLSRVRLTKSGYKIMVITHGDGAVAAWWSEVHGQLHVGE